MSSARNEYDPLIEAAELDAKPALMRAAHVGANQAVGNFPPVRMRPPNSTGTDVCAASDESLSSEAVQIQLQSILEANTFTRSWHPKLQSGTEIIISQTVLKAAQRSGYLVQEEILRRAAVPKHQNRIRLPESIEHNRLCRLQDPFMAKMDSLIREMWVSPAHTARRCQRQWQEVLSGIGGLNGA
jgi:hypothetical protein